MSRGLPCKGCLLPTNVEVKLHPIAPIAAFATGLNGPRAARVGRRSMRHCGVHACPTLTLVADALAVHASGCATQRCSEACNEREEGSTWALRMLGEREDFEGQPGM